jgi:hypothetical protein
MFLFAGADELDADELDELDDELDADNIVDDANELDDDANELAAVPRLVALEDDAFAESVAMGALEAADFLASAAFCSIALIVSCL